MRTLHLQRTLGAGAFGTVYLAELASDQGPQQQVAVKVLQKTGPEAALLLARIRDEARLLALLQDKSILKVLDMVRLDGRDAVLMEFVDGEDLASLVKRAPLPPRVAAEVGSAVAGALACAHAATHPSTGASLNVIHRDVKPANIMVTATGGVKLLDFGIARARFDARESQTGQLVLGTLNYMAPEYVVTGEVSPAADVYGLASTLFEVATGRLYGPPKVRPDSHERRLERRLGALRPDLEPLASLLRDMLDWDPTRRPPAAALETLLLEAADAIGGQGLRSWARQTVPAVLANRSLPPDPAGLSGRSFSLGARSAQADRLDGALPEIPPGPALLEPAPPGAQRETPSPSRFLASPVPSASPAEAARGTQTRDESRETGHNDRMGLRARPSLVAHPHRHPAPPGPSPAVGPRASLSPPSSPPPAAPASPAASAGTPSRLVRTVLVGLAAGTVIGLVLVGVVIVVLLNA